MGLASASGSGQLWTQSSGCQLGASTVNTGDHPSKIFQDGQDSSGQEAKAPASVGLRVESHVASWGSLLLSKCGVGATFQGGDLLVRKEESVEELTSLFLGTL